MHPLSQYSCRVGGMARPDVAACSTDSTLLHVKQPMETSKKKFRVIQRWIYSYGPFEPVLWSCLRFGATGRRRRAVPIPHYSM